MKWLSDRNVARLREEVELPDLSGTKYECIRRVGSGGMGAVYLAQDTGLGRKVALKVMNTVDTQGGLSARMLREAHIVALLEHPGIVPIHDVGTLPDGRVFYTMKLVQGGRLDEYAKKETSLPDLLRIFQRICEAVAFAHAHRVIHRDLKPENIMAGPFGEVLVMDWGVAKVLPARREAGGLEGRDAHGQEGSESGRESLLDMHQATTLPLGLAPGGPNETAGGTVIGTPAYMPPEQALGETDLIDERSDVYALGGILYFLLTGRAPYADTPTNANGREPEGPPRPRHLNSKIPRPLEAIALKGMAKRRDQRYGGAQQMADDVVRYLDGRQISAYRENIFEVAARWLKRNQVLVLLILAYLLMRLIVFFSFRS